MQNLPDRIEAIIADNRLETGARLPSERQLAAELGVSRSSLREAIQHLTTQGRLISRRGGGTYVAELPMDTPLHRAFLPLTSLVKQRPDYWQDVMEIRKSLEGDAAFYAAERASDADKIRLKAELERMSHAITDASAASAARADADFHMMIVHASHNAVFAQVMAGLFDLLEESISHSLEALYHLPSTVDMLERQHAAIIEAILAGRAAQARTAALDHLAFVERTLRPIEDAAARQRRASHALSRSLS
ncbi:GntR family L-lactate dehydrogenase operon transcriptional regulator [Agrobacterium vitis]|nr:GntR family L-lactate dehydrogenase operon transcriptional regulator [Agrobacterium vitis]MBE1436531.1 GntR family L-lactate dehydrogenase operon transcriptional regulator [Agrobacterium vitis]